MWRFLTIWLVFKVSTELNFLLAISMFKRCGAKVSTLTFMLFTYMPLTFLKQEQTFLCLCLGRRIANIYFSMVVTTQTSSDPFCSISRALMVLRRPQLLSVSPVLHKNNLSNFCLVISMKLEIAINQNIFDIIWHHQLNYIKKNWISYPCEVGVLNAIDFSDDSFKLKWLKAFWQNPKGSWQCVPSSAGFEQIESLQILLKSTDLPSCFLQSMKQLLWKIMEINAWAVLVYFWLHIC